MRMNDQLSEYLNMPPSSMLIGWTVPQKSDRLEYWTTHSETSFLGSLLQKNALNSWQRNRYNGNEPSKESEDRAKSKYIYLLMYLN